MGFTGSLFAVAAIREELCLTEPAMTASGKGEEERFQSCRYSGSKMEFILLFHPKFKNKQARKRMKRCQRVTFCVSLLWT